MCGRVGSQPWSARWTQIRWFWDWLGPGNTNVRAWEGGEGGWVVPLPRTHPPVHPATRSSTVHCGLPRATGHWEHAHMIVLGSPKEILGVNNAQCTPDTLTGCVGTAATLRPSALRPSPGAYSSLYLSISQYFSVFSGMATSQLYLRYISGISQVWLHLSYISVYLSISQYPAVARLQGRGTALRSSCSINEERRAVLGSGVLMRAAAGNRPLRVIWYTFW